VDVLDYLGDPMAWMITLRNPRRKHFFSGRKRLDDHAVAE
jgi:hypothetical protein